MSGSRLNKYQPYIKTAFPVEAKMAGFRRAFRSGVGLQIQQTAVVDFTLELGAISEQVEVTAQTPALESTASALGKVVDNRRILELPLNTRNVYSLIFLTPGVTGSIGNNYNSLSYSGNARAFKSKSARAALRSGPRVSI